jgi:O-antigen ligase
VTRAAPLEWISASRPQVRFGLGLSLGVFYLGEAVTYLPTLIPAGAGPALMAAGLLLSILIAPIEYAVGAVGFALLAAGCSGTRAFFNETRWVLLGTATLVLPLRFVLFRRQATYPTKVGLFDYLVILFVAISGATLLTTISVAMTALKLGASSCVLYVVSQGAYRLSDLYGAASPRRLIFGWLSFAAAPVVVSALGFVFHFGPASLRGGWFVGLLGNGNAWAVLVATVLPWCACLLFRRARNWSGARFALGAAVAILVYLLLLSGSRAGLLGGLVAISLLVGVHLDRRVGAALLLLTFFFAVRAVADPDYVPRTVQKYLYKHAVAGREDVFQSRLEPWKRSEQNFREHPWMGYGFGISSATQVSWTPDTQSGAGTVETGSSFWGTLGQIGILGAVPLFAGLVLLAVRAVRFCWRVRDPWLTAVCASLLALIVNALFEGWLLAPGSFTAFYFWGQCFLLNGMMSRFRPAPARRSSLPQPEREAGAPRSWGGVPAPGAAGILSP